jgi:hypothetical protein
MLVQYIGFYVIFWQQLYLRLETPVGGLKSSLAQPRDMPLRAKDFSFCKQYEGSKRSGEHLAIADCMGPHLLRCVQSLRWTVSFTTTLKQCTLPTARMPCSSPLVRRRTLFFSLSFFDLLTFSRMVCAQTSRSARSGWCAIRPWSATRPAGGLWARRLSRSSSGSQTLQLIFALPPLFCFALTGVHVVYSDSAHAQHDGSSVVR